MSGAIAGGDGSYPHFRNLLDPGKRVGIDNPDTYYRAVNVSNKDGKNVYIVTGNRGTTETRSDCDCPLYPFKLGNRGCW